MKRLGSCTAHATAVAALWATSVLAQTEAHTEQSGPQTLPTYGRSVATVNDTSALVQNPANVAFIPGGELRWQGYFLDEGAAAPFQGHSIALGGSLPKAHVGGGFRADFVNPPYAWSGTDEDRYNWLTWGIGVGSPNSAALGVTVQRSYSNDPTLHALVAWSAGLTLRPWNALGLGVVAHAFNAPTNDSHGYADRTFDFGAALRPTGSDAIEMGIETRLVDVTAADPADFWVPRATLDVTIPRVGRLRGDLAVVDPHERAGAASWQASVALAVRLNGGQAAGELAGGSTFGDRLGETAKNRAAANAFAEVALRSVKERSGIELPRFAVRVRLEETPGPRQHVTLLRQLWDIADHERAVDAVVLELRAPPADSLGAIQELRDAIRHLRLAGKRVLCHLEDGGGAALYACAGANRVLLSPAGEIRFAGLKSQQLYFARLLDKLGIRAEFVRIGKHKSAPEPLERERASDVARADHVDLMQQIERYLVGGIATGRALTVPEVRARVAAGPFVASDAKTAGFIDGVAFDDEVEQRVNELVGRRTHLVEVEDLLPRRTGRFGAGRRLAIVHATGSIVDGRSRVIPLANMNTLGSYTLVETLKDLREDDSVRAIVLRVDSPGGSALASDVMWREISLTAEVKPVVVSMGGVAASGGYYIAAPGSRIFANPLTITGSIGIFSGKADISRLTDHLGVGVESYKTAPRADAESPFRPYTAEERREIERRLRQHYDRFLDRVAAGRSLTKEEIDRVGQGRVWTGEQAQRERLVDELGGLREALDYARRIAHLPAHVPIIELPPQKTTLIGQVLDIEGIRKTRGVPWPPGLEPLLAAAGPFLVYEPDQPLALLELAPIEL
ncbi:MAG: signal peptide peptidase SppA [Polyangiaceae bacterium]|nr:signal peptide peptidase SppA [Polyangiaceae bacterium]